MESFQARMCLLVIYVCGISLGYNLNKSCDTTQYLLLGNSGIIKCQFQEGFLAVHWYNSSNVFDYDPLISYDSKAGGTKYGPGYTTGEFDIDNGGSLIIKNVSVNHETIFQVFEVTSDVVSPDVHKIGVHVLVKPSEPCPIVDYCGCESTCYIQWRRPNNVSCRVSKSRPAIDLSWHQITSLDERELTYIQSVTNKSSTYSSLATLINPLGEAFNLELIQCKAENIHGILEKNDTLVLVHDVNFVIPGVEHIKKQFERHSGAKLKCGSKKSIHLVVWERNFEDANKTLTYGIFSDDNAWFQNLSNGYTLDEEGSLIITDIDIHHEGIYICSYNDKNSFGCSIYNITVYVPPVPASPVIEGCLVYQYCVLTKNMSGSLTCSIRGVRPAVHMEFRILDGKSGIQLSHNELVIHSNGNTSDIILTTQYTVQPATNDRFLIGCRAIGPGAHLFLTLSTAVDLVVVSSSGEPDLIIEASSNIIVITLTSFGVVFVVLIVFGVSCFIVKRNRTSPARGGEEEMESMISNRDGELDNKKDVQELPVLEDIVNIPELLSLYHKITGKEFEIQEITTVTAFFNVILPCHEVLDEGKRYMSISDWNISAFNKLAYECLIKRHETIHQKDLERTLGKEATERYLQLGILQRDSCGLDISDDITFCHSLVCQWFAAQHMAASLAKKINDDKSLDKLAIRYLDLLELSSFPSLYRFICGINKTAGDSITRNIGGIDGYKQFRILCLIENTENPCQVKKITTFFSTPIWFTNNKRGFLERCNLQLLKIANSRKIPISAIELRKSFSHVDDFRNEFVLTSGIRLPVLHTLVELLIECENTNLGKVPRYAAMCNKLETVRFHSDTLLCLPQDTALFFELHKRTPKLQVLCASKNNRFHLNLQSGKWEDENGDETAFKKQLFMETIQANYKALYTTVKPIPYIEKNYNVDDLFVEGGAEELVKGKWQKIESSKDYFANRDGKSKRSILEGAPGYGKSTLALEIGYEWCIGKLQSVDILILLRLRQLGDVKSIFRAIKVLLLSKEQRISTDDVETIIKGTRSLKIIFDGYDEYPDRSNDSENVIYRTINMNILKDMDVILATRYIPNCLRISLPNICKLTGFDKEAQIQYIRKTFVEYNTSEIDKLRKSLGSNPFIESICDIPLFFAMIVHMAKDDTRFSEFSSLTELFDYILKCIHGHTRNKDGDKYLVLYECEHAELSKVAFEGLSKKDQQIQWDKDILCKRLGSPFYDHIIATGILVEEEFTDINNDTASTKTTVHFYHKVFCEWYAAFFLAKLVSEGTTNLALGLKNVDPMDLQYLYRFACGIDPASGLILIRHLMDCYEKLKIYKLVTLCALECKGKSEIPDEIIDRLCGEVISLRESESKLQRRATFNLFNLATEKRITLASVDLIECFQKALGNEITLRCSGDFGSLIPLPVMKTVEKIRLLEKPDRTYTKEDIEGIMRYGIQSNNLKKIVFQNGIPPHCSNVDIPMDYNERNVLVLDQANSSILDLNTGHWKSIEESLDGIRETCKETVCFDETGNEKQHALTIRILERASQNEISIFRLFLNESFRRLDEDDIIVSSGLHLPYLSTVEQFRMIRRKTKINLETFLGILKYAQCSPNLKEVRFLACMLPVYIDLEDIPRHWRVNGVEVWFHPTEVRKTSYKLNLDSGKWLIVNETELTNEEVEKQELTQEGYEQQEEDYMDFWRKLGLDRPWNGFD